MTTRDPGASDVFTQGLERSPRATAFSASNPAASITCGFDVLVQLVIAAMTTCPSATSTGSSPTRVVATRNDVSALSFWPSAARATSGSRLQCRSMPPCPGAATVLPG